MNKEEQKNLINLLNKLKDKNLTIPNMPISIWYAINKIVPLLAVEVIITNTGEDFLLTKRKDTFWDGWHIPGGFIACGELPEDACKRVAKKELGIDVNFKKLISVYFWRDHPYASSISLLCICTPKMISKKGRFFKKIPRKIVSHHDEFIKEFLQNKN